MPSEKPSVLVVDDDMRVLRVTQDILGDKGYRVFTSTDGHTGLEVLRKENPDVVLLDIMMPGMDGLTVCRRIREFSRVPIIMVTAKGDDEEKAKGLDAGADDYVTKPFSAIELAARIRAVLRRATFWDDRPEPAFSSGDLVIDFARHMVTLNGEEVDLTTTEYRLLSHLARNAGHVLAFDEILETVWDDRYVGENHLLQVNIARLRHKLGEDRKNPKHILTKHTGYVMAKDL
ncbi:MAG: response regulator transcription factor [Chloroflexi bacterium]|nr:response regulator transcription factor [Chloroflexota bacterium]